MPVAFRLMKVENIDDVWLDMNWSVAKARIVKDNNPTATLMCVTLLSRQFVEPPTEQQADQGSVLALKDVDGISPTTASPEGDVAGLKRQSPLDVASDKDASVFGEGGNGVETIVGVETVDVDETGFSQPSENELDGALWIPPPLEEMFVRGSVRRRCEDPFFHCLWSSRDPVVLCHRCCR